MTKRKAAGRRPADESDQGRRRARRNRQAAMARARAASPNGPRKYAERSTLIDEYLRAVTYGHKIRWRDVERTALEVRRELWSRERVSPSTRTIRRRAERIGLIADHNARR